MGVVRAAVMADVRASATAAGVEAPAGLLVFRSDTARQRVEAISIGSNLPGGVAGEVASRTAARLSGWPGSGRAVLFLRLDSLPVPEIPVGELRAACAPELANLGEVHGRLLALFQQNRALQDVADQRRQTRLRILVSRTGEVVHSEVERTSGDGQTDAWAASVATAMRFHPASVSGVPRDAWAIVPITLVPETAELPASGSGRRP
jgi:hypothetical protein